jgi:Cu/Ag efflux pump CusA
VIPGTSFPAFLSYVLAALLGVFLIIQAAAGSWRLAWAAFLSIPVAMGGGMLVIFLAGWQGSLGAAAGLAGLFALAARMAVSVIARIRAEVRAPASGGRPDERAADITTRIARAAVGPAGHVLTVAIVTGTVLAPFALSGGTAGLELLFPAACVLLAGLVTLTLAGMLVLPAQCLRAGPALTAPDLEGPDGELVPSQRPYQESTAHQATV